jgi:YHS domain-containing protein
MFRLRDSVCGAKVKKKTEFFLQYKDKIFYFDCQACRETFKNNPDSYIGKKKGFFSWLNKGTDGVPKSCHECHS